MRISGIKEMENVNVAEQTDRDHIQIEVSKSRLQLRKSGDLGKLRDLNRGTE